jgi:hypothetical protein
MISDVSGVTTRPAPGSTHILFQTVNSTVSHLTRKYGAPISFSSCSQARPLIYGCPIRKNEPHPLTHKCMRGPIKAFPCKNHVYELHTFISSQLCQKWPYQIQLNLEGLFSTWLNSIMLFKMNQRHTLCGCVLECKYIHGIININITYKYMLYCLCDIR